MATVTLGNIKLNWKGAYNAGTAYAIDDVVSYNGSSYVAKTATTGNLPTVTANWDIMSQAGTNGTNGTDLTSTLTTQGDILYRDGSGLAKLGAGTSGQVLQTGGTGANPSWADASSGKIVNVFYQTYTSTLTQSTPNSGQFRDVPSLTQTITPASVDSKFLITFRLSMGTDGNHTYARINAGGNPVHIAPANSSSLRTTSSVAAKATWDMDELTGTFLWDANTASSTTIKIEYAVESVGYINRGQRDDGNWYDSRAVSEMTILEINN